MREDFGTSTEGNAEADLSVLLPQIDHVRGKLDTWRIKLAERIEKAEKTRAALDMVRDLNGAKYRALMQGLNNSEARLALSEGIAKFAELRARLVAFEGDVAGADEYITAIINDLDELEQGYMAFKAKLN